MLPVGSFKKHFSTLSCVLGRQFPEKQSSNTWLKCELHILKILAKSGHVEMCNNGGKCILTMDGMQEFAGAYLCFMQSIQIGTLLLVSVEHRI